MTIARTNVEAAIASVVAQIEKAQRDSARLLETDLIVEGRDVDSIDDEVHEFLEHCAASRVRTIRELRDRLRLEGCDVE